MAGKSVADGPIDEVCACELSVIRGRVGVLVVRDHDHERQLLNGSLVEGFVARSGGGGTIPDTGGANGALDALEPVRHEGAVDHGDHGSEVGDHREHAFLRAASMDVAVPSSHRTRARTDVGPGVIEDGLPEGEARPLVPDEWGEDIATSERKSCRDAERFLSATQKNAAGDLAGTVQARDALFGGPREEHEPEPSEEGFGGHFVSCERFRGHRLNGGVKDAGPTLELL